MAAATRAEGIDLECRLLMPGGKINIYTLWERRRAVKPAASKVIGAVMDVTTRKLTEIELRREQGAFSRCAEDQSRPGSVGNGK